MMSRQRAGSQTLLRASPKVGPHIRPNALSWESSAAARQLCASPRLRIGTSFTQGDITWQHPAQSSMILAVLAAGVPTLTVDSQLVMVGLACPRARPEGPDHPTIRKGPYPDRAARPITGAAREPGWRANLADRAAQAGQALRRSDGRWRMSW